MNIKTVFYHVLVLAVINSAAQAEPAATSTVRAKHVKKHDETQASRADNLSTGSPWSWIKRQAGRAGKFVKKHKKPIIAAGATATLVSLIAYMLHRRRVTRLQGEHQGELSRVQSEHRKELSERDASLTSLSEAVLAFGNEGDYLPRSAPMTRFLPRDIEDKHDAARMIQDRYRTMKKNREIKEMYAEIDKDRGNRDREDDAMFTVFASRLKAFQEGNKDALDFDIPLAEDVDPSEESGRPSGVRPPGDSPHKDSRKA